MRLSGKFMKVKNLEGTASLNCSCQTWLNHWENHSGASFPTKCCVKGCGNNPEVGAHVQRNDFLFQIFGIAESHWIVPMCIHHNNQRGMQLSIWDETKLVSADIFKTCKRKTPPWWHKFV
jgi:hypothetical protein